MNEIKEVQKEWLEAKYKAARRQELNGNFALAAKLDGCTMFGGGESFEQLAELMFTSQGVEFLTKHGGGFPDMAVFRRFKRFKPEKSVSI